MVVNMWRIIEANSSPNHEASGMPFFGRQFGFSWMADYADIMHTSRNWNFLGGLSRYFTYLLKLKRSIAYLPWHRGDGDLRRAQVWKGASRLKTQSKANSPPPPRPPHTHITMKTRRKWNSFQSFRRVFNDVRIGWKLPAIPQRPTVHAQCIEGKEERRKKREVVWLLQRA